MYEEIDFVLDEEMALGLVVMMGPAFADEMVLVLYYEMALV